MSLLYIKKPKVSFEAHAYFSAEKLLCSRRRAAQVLLKTLLAFSTYTYLMDYPNIGLYRAVKWFLQMPI
jgi:hypothetical protein